MTTTRKFKPTTQSIAKPDKLEMDLQNLGRSISAALRAEAIDMTEALAGQPDNPIWTVKEVK